MRLALFALVLALCACDAAVERGVGPAGDFPEVPLATIVAAESGRFNVRGVVNAVDACDPSELALCAAEGALSVSDVFAPSDAFGPPAATVLIDVPEAWRVGDRGVFSVDVIGRNGTVRLLGYSP